MLPTPIFLVPFCPFDGDLDALILPDVNTQSMFLFLQELSLNHVHEHIVLILDRAGWHTAKDLTVPRNITLQYLSPYSPELNLRNIFGMRYGKNGFLTDTLVLLRALKTS